LPASNIPARLRIAGTLLRAVFIIALILVMIRVSMPQNETIWTAYDTPGDLVRMALGFAVCIWLVIQLFNMPKDAAGYRTWLYLGLAAVPFALICLVYVW
jgi:TRAP-type C4-dicarboxylate transport system permease small subunit